MADAPEEPMSPAMRTLRIGFACMLVLALAFSLTMAIWGELRDAMFVRLFDTRYAKSFVIRAPEGARVWLGDKFLGTAALPVIVDSEPDAVIDGLTVQEARVYADEKEFLKQSQVIEPGAAVPNLLAKLAPGRSLVRAGSETLRGPGEFVPVLLREGEALDAALLCTLEIPGRDGKATLFAFLLRLEHEDSRWLQGCTLTTHTTQLSANSDDFWSTREQYDGLPRRVTGQLRTRWLLWPQPVVKDAQPADVRDARWLELPVK